MRGLAKVVYDYAILLQTKTEIKNLKKKILRKNKSKPRWPRLPIKPFDQTTQNEFEKIFIGK